MKYLLGLVLGLFVVSANAQNNWWEFEVKRVVAVHNGIVLDNMKHDFEINGQVILGVDTFEIASKVCRLDYCLSQSEAYMLNNYDEESQTVELHSIDGAHHVQILQQHPQLIFSYSVEPEWSIIYVLDHIGDTENKPDWIYSLQGDNIQDVLQDLWKDEEG